MRAWHWILAAVLTIAFAFACYYGAMALLQMQRGL
jgi:hypothetical protein